LVIADILMPTMDGYEFVRRLRAVAELATTPVIFCTAHFGERDARDLAKQCGVEQVLTKSGELAAILRAVDECLAHSAPITFQSVPENFSLEHVRFLTNKLSAQSTEFKDVNFRLEVLIEIALQLASEPDQASLLQQFCQSARAQMSARYAIVC